MTLEELRKLIDVDLPKLEANPNTMEFASEYRKATKAAYDLDDYPVLAGLEATWKSIEEDSPLLGIERERLESNYDSPLSCFMFNVDTGHYPPPEIMLSLLHGFQLYYAHGGEKSLDEIFFGRPHKKKSSDAFTDYTDKKYANFHFFYERASSLDGKSMTEKAEKYLRCSPFRNENIDPESFLRGYRRYIATLRKPDKN